MIDPFTLGAAAIVFWLVGYSTRTGHEMANSVMVFGRNKLTAFWSRHWPSKNILILGERNAGKTALGWMLTEGTPYKMVDGVKEAPTPTAALVTVSDPRVILSRDSVVQGARLQQDVAGEAVVDWLTLIDELNPEGIVYMIEGNHDLEIKTEQLNGLANNVLTYYGNEPRRLRVLYLFINHMDIWGTSGGDKMQMERQWRTGLLNLIERDFPALKNVRIGVAGTHLNPNRDSWPEAKIAMTQFANMMGK
jgi:hypothetical protein